MLDKSSLIPMYKQLENKLLQEIDEGKWKPGSRFPSEAELMQQTRLSRATVRNALEGLVQKGKLYKRQGQGTFVSNFVLAESATEWLGFSADALSRGLVPGHKLLDIRKIKPPASVVHSLNISPDDSVLYIRRLNLANNTPVGIDDTHLSGPWLSKMGIDINASNLGSGSLYRLLKEEYGVAFKVGMLTVSATNAKRKEAALLECPVNSALLVSEIIAFLDDGTPIEYTRNLGKHDMHKWIVRLSQY
jgi:GntR family transcriptional regulator